MLQKFKRFANFGVFHKMNFSQSQLGFGIKTPLYSLHLSNRAKIVNINGYKLPSYYMDQSPEAENLYTRKFCSLFDTSNTGIFNIYGEDKIELLESLSCSNIKEIQQNKSIYTIFLNANGGIIGHAILANCDEYFMIKTIDDSKEKLLTYFSDYIANQFAGKEANIRHMEDFGQLSLQGPFSERIMHKLFSFDFPKLKLMETVVLYNHLIGCRCRIFRCGITGEDGFEIILPIEKTLGLAEMILLTQLEEKEEKVKLAGVKALDSLRIETGICQYNKELNEMISPIEAKVRAQIGLRRIKEGGFLGHQYIVDQFKVGVALNRKGFLSGSIPLVEG